MTTPTTTCRLCKGSGVRPVRGGWRMRRCKCTPAPPKDRGPNAATHIGECGVCERRFTVDRVSERLAMHGFTRPGHGWLHGKCPGENMLPGVRLGLLRPAQIALDLVDATLQEILERGEPSVIVGFGAAFRRARRSSRGSLAGSRPSFAPSEGVFPMKPYGQKRRDHGCCPGHDKFPLESYETRASKRTRTKQKKVMHGIARARARAELRRELRDLGGELSERGGTHHSPRRDPDVWMAST